MPLFFLLLQNQSAQGIETDFLRNSVFCYDYFYFGPSYLFCPKYRCQRWAKSLMIKDFILGSSDVRCSLWVLLLPRFSRQVQWWVLRCESSQCLGSVQAVALCVPISSFVRTIDIRPQRVPGLVTSGQWSSQIALRSSRCIGCAACAHAVVCELSPALISCRCGVDQESLTVLLPIFQTCC